MFVDETINGLRAHLRSWREAGQTIALVPTMGNLHDGHLTLLKTARAYADKVVVSIFVNPLQFNDTDDLAAYPQTLNQDIQKLSDVGQCDVVFAPDGTVIYPAGMENHTRIIVPQMDDKLCGLQRPGHFEGVATVVTKLFCIVQPDVAVFGEKDYQQLQLISQLVEDLSLAIKVIGAPTLREADGLAMSSRNQHLTDSERQTAGVIYQQLSWLKQQLESGEQEISRLVAQAETVLASAGLQVQYLEIRRSVDLQAADLRVDRSLRVFIAARLGSVRLIDNVAVSLPDKS